MRVALATCRELPEPDHDQPLLLDALAREGLDASMLAWDEPAARPEDFDLVVLRSTWNYHHAPEAFVAWCERVAKATRLENPIAVVRENVDKRYLLALEARGLAIVPTVHLPQGEIPSVAALSAERGWTDIVVKPSVSAGSHRTARFGASNLHEADAFARELAKERGVLVQRWMPSVEGYGERSLIHVDGELTHAVRKSPRFANGEESVTGPMPIADDERAFAARALASVSSELLYARVDVVRDEEGVLRLMELELLEPSLHLGRSEAALQRFVKAIRRRALAAREVS